MTRTAAVVGGGIGGLAAAIGLRAANWDVTVFERADGLPATGTGLGIWPTTLRALDRLGVGERLRAEGKRQPSGAMLRPDGSRIGMIDVDRLERKQGEPVYLIARPELLRLLADALPDGTIRFGSPVGEIGELRAGHDLVVGADGINSRVRTEVFGAARLRYAGAVCWTGTAELAVEAGGEIWGSGAKFGFTPRPDERTNFYGVLKAPERHRPPGDQVDVLRDLFGGWHDPVGPILDRIDRSDLLVRDLRYLDPLPTFVNGGVALLGDAAHAMTPDLGQGACQALLDGTVLADCLATGDLTTGLTAYDRRRRPPTQRLAAMALRVSRLAQVRRFLPARDALLRLALALGPPS